jgi:hypothetical protein
LRRLTVFNLFVAFAFTVMADPVSSVAYAVEAALRELDGDLSSLFPAMAIVVGVIAVVSATYHQLIGRFPDGGGGPRGVAVAFGEGWAFVPIGALIVDFTLTVAISCAAAASAAIAYAPELASLRMPLACGLAALVAAMICLGNRGRVVFATATLFFLLTALAVLGEGASDAVGAATPRTGGEPLIAGAALVPVLFAVPLGMALATGVESPSDAIAQLGELDRRRKRIFGQLTIWLMVAIVGGLTLGLAAIAVSTGTGLPPADSTLLAEVAREVTGGGATFAAFQAASALLLLAAAASAYLAASGLLRALALHGGDSGAGLLPARLAERNRVFVPFWGVALVLGVSLAMLLAAGAEDQELVHFYAVSVFASFLGALLGCARLSYLERRRAALVVNAAGAILVAFVLAVNLTRLDGVIALAASGLAAAYLWRIWVRRGRPGGVAEVSLEEGT